MTADGELYIDEECRDCFERELNDWFGEEWRLNGSPFGDFWDMSNFPDEVEVNVEDEDGEVIGKVKIINEFYVEDDGYGRSVQATPKSIILLEIKDELANMVRKKTNEQKI